MLVSLRSCHCHVWFLSFVSKLFHLSYRRRTVSCGVFGCSGNAQGVVGVLRIIQLQAVPRFSEQSYLREKLEDAGQRRDHAHTLALAAVRDQLGPEKALLLSHLRHVTCCAEFVICFFQSKHYISPRISPFRSSLPWFKLGTGMQTSAVQLIVELNTGDASGESTATKPNPTLFDL